MVTCSHFDEVEYLEPPAEIAGCEDCLRSGGCWVHLRLCQTCGRIGCCDSSPSRHASRHARESGLPVLRSVEPGENWSWCVIDEAMFVLSHA